MKNNISIIIVFSTLALMSCGNYKSDFEKLVGQNINDIDELNTIDNNGIKYSTRRYVKMFMYGKKINEYLLSQAVSVQKTNWVFGSIPVQLTRGDVAIVLLMEINDIDYRVIMEGVINTTQSSSDFWSYIHADEKNRQIIVEKIKKIIFN